MVRCLLLTAVFVASAAALAPLFEGCGCGSPIAVVEGVSTQYCPYGPFTNCTTTLLKYDNCTLTCEGLRSKLAYRRVAAIPFLTTASITCKAGQYTTAEGNSIPTTLNRPTCALKAPCDDCGMAEYETCAAGMTCKPGNLVIDENTDGCNRATCSDGSLRLYQQDGSPIAFTQAHLYCTTNKTWSSSSYDGVPANNSIIPFPFSANCVLPKTCENCTAPKFANDLSQLPVAFRTGYDLAMPTHFKEEKSCSRIECAEGYKLVAFNSSTSTGTGYEYTSYGYLKCNINVQWADGGFAPAPANITVACVAPAAPTTTPRPTTKAPTTVWPCGAFDEVTLVDATLSCKEDGQTVVVCPATKKIMIQTTTEHPLFESMAFIAGKGWLSFDCDGSARLWKTGSNEIAAVACENSI